MKEILSQTKKLFEKMVEDYRKDPYGLINHIYELEKRVDKVCKMYPELDKDVLLMSVYLHDIGHYPINPDEDHAVTGERITKEFLTSKNINSEFISKVCHCVRSHRNKDVTPQTLEAKMMACIDSASHFTDEKMYSSIIFEGKCEYGLGKIERDRRDVSVFPEIQKEVEGLYYTWKKLVEEYMKIKN